MTELAYAVSSNGRRLIVLVSCLALVSCASADEPGEMPSAVEASAAPASFDGAGYSTNVEMIAHGERIAEVLTCNSCHLPDYSGVNFGEIVLPLEGLWATNISLTIPEMTDDELERLLREGEHPTREMYLMPSKASQFLGARDMDALIAFLRTVEPTGDPTPPPPPGFEEAVASRLPDDYWRWQEPGAPRTYANSVEEAAYFAENAAPDLGAEHARGRLVALTVCTSCHGAALDGFGESAGDVQAAVEYDDAAFERLLQEGLDRRGREIQIEWGIDHAPSRLTDREISAVIEYVRRLAEVRTGSP